jgi:hypothetical protein
MCFGNCGCSCCSKSGILFKLSLMGFLFSTAMMLIGLFWPLNILVVPIPMAWAMAIVVLIPSMAVYYSVCDKFWAEVEAEMKSKDKPKGEH